MSARYFSDRNAKKAVICLIASVVSADTSLSCIFRSSYP